MNLTTKRCCYGDCNNQLPFDGTRKYCELHKEVRTLESRKKGTLKKQMKKYEEPLYEIQCKFCNTKTMSITGAKKYCSNTCRQKYQNRHWAIKKAEEQIIKQQEKIKLLRTLK